MRVVLQVLFLDPTEDGGLVQLRRLAAVAAATFTATAVATAEAGRAFSPHLTVAKLSQLSGRARSIRRISEARPAAWSP